MADEDAKTQKKLDYHPCKNEEMTLLKCIDESNHIFWKVHIKATDIPNPIAPNRSTINTAVYEILQGDKVLAAIPEQNYANSFDILSGLKIDRSNENKKMPWMICLPILPRNRPRLCLIL